MKLLEVFKNNSSKFFSRNTICRTIKAGYVYVEDKKIWIPSETKLTIEYFDIYSNKNMLNFIKEDYNYWL